MTKIKSLAYCSQGSLTSQMDFCNFHNLYRSPSIGRVTKSRRLRWAGYVVRKKGTTNVFKTVTGKRLSKKPKYRWEDDVRVHRK